ncbi:MAG: Cdc6/Cdc18 family protein [Thermoplasmata archaeon]
MFPEGGTSVFKDIGKLSFEYLPERLVHREKQMKRLSTLFTPTIESNITQNAFLIGSVGTGKTHLSKRFCIDFQKYANSKGKNLEYVIVNCRQRNTDSAVLLKILTHFDERFPDRGFSITEMLQILRKHIQKRKAHLLVVLDEADVLLKKSGSDLVYSLSRFDEESVGQKSSVSMILISQKNVLDIMDVPSLSTFKRTNIIEFGKYTANELGDVVRDRVELAFHPGTVENQSVSLIADIASEWGDARYAIELLEKAGMLADEEGSKEVTPENVRAAKAETYSTVTESKIIELDPHKKLVLLGIARKMRKEAYITTGEAEDGYAIACEEFGERKRGHTQFWKYLKELDALGLIDTKVSREGMVGKTTLISLPEIPARVLEERLESGLRP